MSALPRGERILEVREARGKRFVDAVAMDCDRGDRFARNSGELLTEGIGVIVQHRQRFIRGGAPALVHDSAVLDQCCDGTARRLLESGVDVALVPVELIANQFVPRVEAIDQLSAGRGNQIMGVVSVRAQLRAELFVRGGQSLIEIPAVDDDRVVQLFAGLVEAGDETVASGEDHVGNARPIGLKAADKVGSPNAKVLTDRLARLDKARRDGFAM